jgi:hypothetical protein
MKEKYLPIGTVVLLTNGTKKVMVTGYLPIDIEADNKMYDYTGCLFPEGVIIDSETLAFNHDQIQEIVFEGLNNDESAEFIKTIKNIANINNQPETSSVVEPQPAPAEQPVVEAQASAATETLSEEPVPSAPVSQVAPEGVPGQPAIAQPMPVSSIPNLIQIQPMQPVGQEPVAQPMQPQEDIVPFGGN